MHTLLLGYCVFSLGFSHRTCAWSCLVASHTYLARIYLQASSVAWYAPFDIVLWLQHPIGTFSTGLLSSGIISTGQLHKILAEVVS